MPDPLALESEHAGAGTAESLEALLQDLMVRYQRADTAAVSALVDRVSPQLYRFFRRNASDQPEAADMLQDTWLRVHRSRHTYRPGSPVLPWMYAIANRVRIDNYRRRRRRSIEIAVDVLPERARQTEGRSEEGFHALLACLPEGQRTAITMLKMDGFTIEEVANLTRSTVGSVKQKVHRAYQQLRKQARSIGMALEHEKLP